MQGFLDDAINHSAATWECIHAITLPVGLLNMCDGIICFKQIMMALALILHLYSILWHSSPGHNYGSISCSELKGLCVGRAIKYIELLSIMSDENIKLQWLQLYLKAFNGIYYRIYNIIYIYYVLMYWNFNKNKTLKNLWCKYYVHCYNSLHLRVPNLLLW